ncbi:MAG: SPASM domain-containing protein, partial [Armatimonadetes bacterium]|nr:SPASM domain-containing protein [Armatimonadota bacterium]
TETLEYAAEQGLTTTIITNGTLIAESEAKRLNDTSLAYITLSLDGADRRVHEYIRGKGTFARVLHSFELLKTHFRRPAFLYFTISKLNSHQIPEMFSLAARMNCDGIRFRPVLPVGRAVRHGDLLLGRQEYRESLQKIQELASDSSIGVDIPRSDSLCSDKETVINYDLYSNFGCIAGNTFIHVDPHGNLYPCQYLESPDFAAGNLFTSSLRHVWDTAPIFRVFRTFEGNPKCLSCELFANCKGGCRARPILFGDDMNAPDPWCSRAEE